AIHQVTTVRQLSVLTPVGFSAAPCAGLLRHRIPCQGKLSGKFSQLCRMVSKGAATGDSALFGLCFWRVYLWNFAGSVNAGHCRTGAAYRNSLGTKATGTVRLPDFVRKPLGAEEIQPVAGRGAWPNGAYRRGNTRVS